MTGSAAAAALVIDNPTIAPLVAGKINAGFSGTLAEDSLKVDEGTLGSDALSGAFAGDVSLADGSVTLELKVDVASAALPSSIRPVLAERVDLTASIVRDTEGHVSASPFAVSSGALSASGKIQSANEEIAADISGQLGDVGLLAKDASGAVEFAMTAKGALSAPDVSLTVTSDRIEAMQREITDLTLTAAGKADLANLAADVTLSGTLAGQSLNGEASLATVSGRREIKGLSLALGQNRVSGDLVLDQNFRPLGTLDFAFADIAPLAALANQTAQGDMNGTIRFAEAGGTPQIALDGKATTITRADLSAQDVSISAVIADYLATPVISGKVQAVTLTAGNTVVRDIDVALRRDGVWTGFDAGAIVSGIPARAAGRLQIADGGVAIELSSGEAALQDFKATLAQPSTVRIAGGTTTLDALTLEVAGGTAVLSGAAGAALDLTATFSAPQDGAPLTFGGSDNPINLTVKSASVRATGRAAEPRLDIAALLSKVSTNSASLDNLALTLHSDSFNIGNRAGPVNGSATADAFVVDNASIAPLVSGKLRAELAGTLSTDALTVASGTLRSDALQGAFNGGVSLADGSMTMQLKADVVSAALPAPVRGVLAERTEISAKLGRDAAGGFAAETVSIVSGALNASGNARLDDKSVDATLSGALADVSLLAKDAKGAIEFALTAKGEISGPDISLTVTSDRIEAAQREITGLKLIATGKADRRQSGGRCVADRHGRAARRWKARRRCPRPTASARSRACRCRSARTAFPAISCSTRNSCRSAPSISSFPISARWPHSRWRRSQATSTARSASPTRTASRNSPLKATTAAISRGDISAKNVDISAVIADYVAAPVISGKIRAATVTSGNDRGPRHRRDADARRRLDGFHGGATVSDIPAKASGRLQVAGGKTTIELATAQATVRGVNAALARPSTVAIADGVTTLDKLVLDLGGGSAVISGTVGTALNLNATLAAVPASIANSFAPGLDAAGSISGTVKVTGAPANPAVGYSIDWTGAQTAQTRSAGFGAMSVSSSGDFAGGKLTFKANVGDGSGLGLKGGGTVDTGSRALAARFLRQRAVLLPDPAACRAGPVAQRHGGCQSAGARPDDFAGYRRLGPHVRRAPGRRALGHRDQRHTRRGRDRRRRRHDPLAQRNAVDRRQHVGLRHGRHRSGAEAFRPICRSRSSTAATPTAAWSPRR